MTDQNKKFITRAVRDKNIREYEKKKGIIKKPSKIPPKGKPITREKIDQAMKPRHTATQKKKVEKPWLIMKPQEKLLVQTDLEIFNALDKSYHDQRKHDNGLKEKGDYRRTTLKFGHCKDCHRVVYYDFFEPHKARKYVTKGLILFDDGKIHHKNIQTRLDDMGLLREPEGWLHLEEERDGCIGNGRVDGYYPVGNEGMWCMCDILEIKSKPTGNVGIMQDDYDQSQLYLKASKNSPALKAAKIKTRNIRILYKDRSLTSEDVHKGWIVQPDIERQNDIMEYMRFLWSVVYKQKKLFPHPYERKSTKCKWCRYHEHCWKGLYKEPTKADVSEIMEVETPTEEMVKTFASRLYAIMKETKELKIEQDKLTPAILKYFIETQTKLLPVVPGEGLGVSQKTTTTWNVPGLVKAIGLEMFAKIGKPDSKKVSDLIKTEYVDAGKFEAFKTSTKGKPYLTIKKVKV